MAEKNWISSEYCFIPDTIFENPEYLGDIPTNDSEPGAGQISQPTVWSFWKWDENNARTYFNSIEGENVFNDELADYLAGTTTDNRKSILEFEIVDSNIAQEGETVYIALMGWIDGTIFDVRLQRIIRDSQGNYTLHTNWGEIYRWQKDESPVIKFFAGKYSRNNYDFACWGLATLTSSDHQYVGRSMQMVQVNLDNILGGGYIKTASGDPNIDKDKTKPTNKIPVGDRKRGGDGSRDLTTSIISLPSLPPKTATSTGFVTLYSVTEAILRLLADKLFTDTWAGAWDNFWQNADEAIAGLSIIPFTPRKGARAKPRVGMYTLDVAMDTIAEQYKEIDCGEIFVDEYYGSCFDYSPYTKVSIFLPYIGIRSLDTDEVMGKTIGVKYYCDVYSGSCMACIYVKVNPNDITEPGNTPTVKYTFSGNCAQQVPTAAASWDRMIQSGIALACVALPAIAAGGSAVGSGLLSAGYYQGTTAGASAYGTSQYAKNAMVASWENAGSAGASMALEGATMSAGMSAKPIVERTGSLGSGVGFLGPQKPFLIRIIPRQSIPDDYMEFKGYPSNEYATLGSLEGFVQVEDIHLTEVYASGPEKDEIMKLLKEGVLL